VALGATRKAVAPPPEACRLALLAASAFATDLTGVDLLPDGRGGWVVLELNGAVDLAPEYSLGGKDVFAEIVEALAFRIAPGLELSDASLERSRLQRAVTLAARPGSPALVSSFGD
jgi:hypothetical protein